MVLSNVSSAPMLMSFSRILALFVANTTLSRIISSVFVKLQSLAARRSLVINDSMLSVSCDMLLNLYLAKIGFNFG